NNTKAFRQVFRRFVYLLKEWNLIEGKTIAIDSFKIRASNSLKNNFNEKKLKRQLQYIDDQITEYEAQLDACDKEEEKNEIQQKIDKRKNQKTKYEDIRKELGNSNEEQISLTDPDSRAVVLHRNIVNVGYNIQASSDDKYKLLVEFDTGSVNDTHALATMAKQTKDLLGVETMDVLADKGYHTGEQIKECGENNITTYVSPKAPSTKDRGLYPVTAFDYNKENDTYTCPQGCQMHTNGKWYKHSENRKGRRGGYHFQRYTTTACKTCKSRHLCTQSKVNGRAIDRSEYAGVIEANSKRVKGNPDYYRQRQQVTEHMFGTMKRQQGFTHTLLRGRDKVLGEVGLMFIGYNLMRCISILGAKELINALNRSIYQIFLLQEGLFLGFLSHFLFSKEKSWSEKTLAFKSTELIQMRKLVYIYD
ncbi:MAG: transposase, partial [Bacteroidales bacterium]|nr:transposase [Bacteroidales bacterium]